MKFIKKKYRLKFYENIKFFIIIFTLIVIFQIYNIPKNVLKIFKFDYLEDIICDIKKVLGEESLIINMFISFRKHI